MDRQDQVVFLKSYFKKSDQKFCNKHYRTPRASNEARQTLFLKLSGTIQRKIGLKALELGGNAVLGYKFLTFLGLFDCRIFFIRFLDINKSLILNQITL